MTDFQSSCDKVATNTSFNFYSAQIDQQRCNFDLANKVTKQILLTFRETKQAPLFLVHYLKSEIEPLMQQVSDACLRKVVSAYNPLS